MFNKSLPYGIIAGIIVSVFMIITMSYYSYCNGDVDMTTSMILGYLAMLIAFSFVVIGIKKIRDKYYGGVISFGKAFLIGLLITFIASTFYVVTWLIYFNFFNPEFIDSYNQLELEKLKMDGATLETIESKRKELEEFGEMYKNPFITAVFTYLEILPIGILVSLLSAIFLKRKNKTN